MVKLQATVEPISQIFKQLTFIYCIICCDQLNVMKLFLPECNQKRVQESNYCKMEAPKNHVVTKLNEVIL